MQEVLPLGCKRDITFLPGFGVKFGKKMRAHLKSMRLEAVVGVGLLTCLTAKPTSKFTAIPPGSVCGWEQSICSGSPFWLW